MKAAAVLAILTLWILLMGALMAQQLASLAGHG